MKLLYLCTDPEFRLLLGISVVKTRCRSLWPLSAIKAKPPNFQELIMSNIFTPSTSSWGSKLNIGLLWPLLIFYNFASRSPILMIFTFLKIALKFIGSSSLLEECGSKNKVAMDELISNEMKSILKI